MPWLKAHEEGDTSFLVTRRQERKEKEGTGVYFSLALYFHWPNFLSLDHICQIFYHLLIVPQPGATL